MLPQRLAMPLLLSALLTGCTPHSSSAPRLSRCLQSPNRCSVSLVLTMTHTIMVPSTMIFLTSGRCQGTQSTLWSQHSESWGRKLDSLRPAWVTLQDCLKKKRNKNKFNNCYILKNTHWQNDSRFTASWGSSLMHTVVSYSKKRQPCLLLIFPFSCIFCRPCLKKEVG